MNIYLKFILRFIKWSFGIVSALFLLVNIWEQYAFDRVISKSREQCFCLRARARIKYTPAILVLWEMHRDKKEMKKNEWSSNLVFSDCMQLFLNGHSRCYVAHCFLTKRTRYWRWASPIELANDTQHPPNSDTP